MQTINTHHRWKHYLLLLAGILCISWSAILVKLAGISGLSSGFYRMFIGTLGVIPFWLYYRKPITDWRGVRVAMLCGTFFAIDIALWNSSIMLSKAAISTLLANLAPVWVGVGAILILKEKPGRIFWTGTAISLLGVSIIIGIDQIASSKLNLGNTLAIIASMFYGAYLLIARKGRVNLDTISFTTISMASSSVVLGLICLFSSTPLWGFSTQTWLSLAALGLVPQLLGWLAINYALGHIKQTVASVSLLSQSVFTALFSVPILGEYLTVREIGGAAVVLSGIYLVNRKK
ncbi:DMT family transporter [Parabacteroides sp. FAFU027]|uniref:DMT family transporter n=1 Tax=Parabacteroides sp. FAFU027 TaxID=2922715 RepID=UPI001FB00D67|nr:DMT family transporter [Parabacteroides sp. FAFU027]